MYGTVARGAGYVKHVNAILAKSKGFDLTMKKTKLVDGGGGKCTLEFTVAPEHLNHFGVLHSGFAAMVVDMVTTYAVMGNPSHIGVSVDLHVSFMKPAKEGDEIIVNANTIRCGRKLAFIECEMLNKKDGSIIARGNQSKYVDLQ